MVLRNIKYPAPNTLPNFLHPIQLILMYSGLVRWSHYQISIICYVLWFANKFLASRACSTLANRFLQSCHLVIEFRPVFPKYSDNEVIYCSVKHVEPCFWQLMYCLTLLECVKQHEIIPIETIAEHAMAPGELIMDNLCKWIGCNIESAAAHIRPKLERI